MYLVQSQPLFLPAALGITGKKRDQYDLHGRARNQPIKSTLKFFRACDLCWSVVCFAVKKLKAENGS